MKAIKYSGMVLLLGSAACIRSAPDTAYWMVLFAAVLIWAGDRVEAIDKPKTGV